MIALVFASQADAQPFLRRYAHGRFLDLTEGEPAQGDDAVILISGTGKIKATLRTEQLLHHATPRQLLHLGTAQALSGHLMPGTLAAAEFVLEGDRVALTAPSYPRMPLSTPDDLPTGTLVTHDHQVDDAEVTAGYWQRLGDMSDTTGYAVAYVAAQHGVPCQILKVITDHIEKERDDFQTLLAEAREQLAETALRVLAQSDASS